MKTAKQWLFDNGHQKEYLDYSLEYVAELMEQFLKENQQSSPSPISGAKEESKNDEKSELGDELCKYCSLEKKGVYSVNGGFVAGCEGSKCNEAYDNYKSVQSEPKEESKESVKTYEIDFAGILKCKINVSDNRLWVEAAMNGYGDGIPCDAITMHDISSPRQQENDESKEVKTSYSVSKMIEGVHDVLVVWNGINQKSKGRVVNNGYMTVVYMNDEFPKDDLILPDRNSIIGYDNESKLVDLNETKFINFQKGFDYYASKLKRLNNLK